MVQDGRVVYTYVAADSFHYFMNIKNLLTAFGFMVSIGVLIFFTSAYYSTKCTFKLCWCPSSFY